MAGMRNSDMYNEAVRSGGALAPEFEDGTPRSPYPYYVVVVDEARRPHDGGAARRRGMHLPHSRRWRARSASNLVVATQRPSVDVVTGVIKANIPSRMAFATASYADSRVILDEGGRRPPHRPRRPGFTSTPRPPAPPDPVRLGGRAGGRGGSSAGAGASAPTSTTSRGIVSEGPSRRAGWRRERRGRGAAPPWRWSWSWRSQLGSTSMLQRKLKVGFSRAGRLMDLLEQRGVVGMSQGSKPRGRPDDLRGVAGRRGGPQGRRCGDPPQGGAPRFHPQRGCTRPRRRWAPPVLQQGFGLHGPPRRAASPASTSRGSSGWPRPRAHVFVLRPGAGECSSGPRPSRLARSKGPGRLGPQPPRRARRGGLRRPQNGRSSRCSDGCGPGRGSGGELGRCELGGPGTERGFQREVATNL